MLILLPPSEGKTPATTGAPVDPTALMLPALAPARRQVLSRLISLCRRTSARSVAESLHALRLSVGQRSEIVRNATLATAPAAPAAQVYTGVLYEALELATLGPSARAWLDETVVIFSGLWGVVRLSDHIPAYRCSVGAALPPPVGGLTAYWKRALREPLDRAAGDGPVLDLRSGAYQALWSPTGAAVATARVLHERSVGGETQRSIVSHFNKATKGRLARALAEADTGFGTIDHVVTALRDLKFTVEERPTAGDRPRQLDVIVKQL